MKRIFSVLVLFAFIYNVLADDEAGITPIDDTPTEETTTTTTTTTTTKKVPNEDLLELLRRKRVYDDFRLEPYFNRVIYPGEELPAYMITYGSMECNDTVLFPGGLTTALGTALLFYEVLPPSTIDPLPFDYMNKYWMVLPEGIGITYDGPNSFWEFPPGTYIGGGNLLVTSGGYIKEGTVSENDIIGPASTGGPQPEDIPGYITLYMGSQIEGYTYLPDGIYFLNEVHLRADIYYPPGIPIFAYPGFHFDYTESLYLRLPLSVPDDIPKDYEYRYRGVTYPRNTVIPPNSYVPNSFIPDGFITNGVCILSSGARAAPTDNNRLRDIIPELP